MGLLATVGAGRSGINGTPSAVQFTNSGNCITVADPTVMHSLTSLTIEAFVVQTATQVNNEMIINYRTSNTGFYLVFNGGAQTIAGRVGNGTTSAFVGSSPVIALGSWVHAAVTWDGTTVTLWVNGVSRATIALSGGNTGLPAIPFAVGNNGSNGTGGHVGAITEVRVSNNVRYSSTFSPLNQRFSSDANTLLLWHLNTGSGTSATDSGPNSLTGTFVGTTQPTWGLGDF